VKCKCGHALWQHINRLGKERGPCCGEKKLYLPHVNAKTRKELLAPFHPGRRAKILKTGTLITPCSCPYYHEIEIGQCLVLKAGE